MNKSTAGFVAVLLVAGFLVAAPVGAQKLISATAVDRIQLYQTNKNDILTWFGPPDATQNESEELLIYQTPKKDLVMAKTSCNLLTISVNKSGLVTGIIYKKYCE